MISGRKTGRLSILSQGTAYAKAWHAVVHVRHCEQVRKAREVDAEKKWVGRMLEREDAIKKSPVFYTKEFGLCPLVYRAAEGI